MSALISRTEVMIEAISRMLEGLRHVAVGAASPIPGSAALLARARSGGRLRVSILGSRDESPFTDGGRELFDCAAQGRVDAFFLSGGQIDGAGNINLVAVGDYASPKARFPGSFGSAYLYMLVPRVILFREDHNRRVMVDRVDFVSAPGTSAPNVYRPGGPHALVTGLCVFAFEKAAGRFRLASVHPGVTAADVRAATGFAYDEPGEAPQSAVPDAASLAILRGEVGRLVAKTYPDFARKAWGIVQPERQP